MYVCAMPMTRTRIFLFFFQGFISIFFTEFGTGFRVSEGGFGFFFSAGKKIGVGGLFELSGVEWSGVD